MSDFFPEEIHKVIGNYVYRLIDPRNGETFYVGKGMGNRVFQHAKAAIKFNENEDNESAKISKILSIRNAGLDVQYIIHRHDIPEGSVYEVEAALIDAYPGLSNIQGGHNSGDRGAMTTEEIIYKYALPTISEPPTEKLILININRLENRFDENEILKQTSVAWKISKKKAESADYILSVVRGVVVAAFEAIDKKWLPATNKYFPNQIAPDNDMPDRRGFVGRKAPDEIWEKFVGERGKRIAIDGMKHIQNPIRYWNIN